MQKNQDQQESLLCYLVEMIVLTDEDVEAIRAASETDPWTDQGINEAPGYGYVYPAKYWDDYDKEDLTIPEGIREERRLGWWVDGVISDEVLRHLRETLGQQRLWRAWPNSDFALVLPDPSCKQPGDDSLLEQLAQVLSLREEEDPALFEVLYIAHIQYGTQVEARRWEDAEGESERIYEHTDFADYGVESHEEHWIPLNAAASRLLEQREIEENQKRLGALRAKQAAQPEENQSPARPYAQALEERALRMFQRHFADLNATLEKLAEVQRIYADFTELVQDRRLLEAKLTLLGELLAIPSLHLAWAIAVIEDHYCPKSGLQDQHYQRLAAWFISSVPQSLLDIPLQDA